MKGIQTWLVTVISLIAGVTIGYYYAQMETGKLQDQISTLKTQLAEKVSSLETQLNTAKNKAESAISELKAEISEKAKLIEDQKAKIEKLEAAPQGTQAPAQ